MDLADFDYADARARMVDSQVRPNKVGDPRILAAMRRLPREVFLPAVLAVRAYGDEDVQLGNGRVLMAPMAIARLVQLLAPEEGQRALVVGAGSGYGAALLAACGARVTALEEDPALHALAADALIAEAPQVALVAGPLAAGWPAGAPYDLILIEGAVASIPATIAGQLRENGGRLVTVREDPPGTPGQAVLAEATAQGARARPAFDCATAMLPAFRPARGFVF
ncbi:MAG: protein-L-isoaspartate O-methyltransferase [Rhodospirillales bacterium]|nr:protein-L-isoaspartate O-methyltransferase [Rhodospirillales bacterium]